MRDQEQLQQRRTQGQQPPELGLMLLSLPRFELDGHTIVQVLPIHPDGHVIIGRDRISR